jgi:hypothetical protein
MKLKELKAFLSKLPEEMDEWELVNGELGELSKEDDEENQYVYRLDKPIIALYCDEDSKEICFFNQTQEYVDNLLNSDNDGASEKSE